MGLFSIRKISKDDRALINVLHKENCDQILKLFKIEQNVGCFLPLKF